MVGISIRGRAAWIASMILGAALLLAGIFTHQPAVMVAGAGFLGFGLVFLIISFAAKGAAA